MVVVVAMLVVVEVETLRVAEVVAEGKPARQCFEFDNIGFMARGAPNTANCKRTAAFKRSTNKLPGPGPFCNANAQPTRANIPYTAP